MSLILEIFKECAPRRSEIVFLEKKHLCFIENFWLIIPPVKTKMRECKISKELFDELMKINTQRLFPEYWGKPDTLSKALKYKLEKYKLPKITFHQFRYTKVYELHKSGMDLKQIQMFIGHNKLETTSNYLILRSEFGYYCKFNKKQFFLKKKKSRLLKQRKKIIK